MLINIIVMAGLERVFKTSFIIFYMLGISFSIENGKLHTIHIYWITDLLFITSVKSISFLL